MTALVRLLANLDGAISIGVEPIIGIRNGNVLVNWRRIFTMSVIVFLIRHRFLTSVVVRACDAGSCGELLHTLTVGQSHG